VLSYLMAAPDAHAKNFSLVLGPKGSFHLTPFYDIMSAYPLFGKKASSLNPKRLNLAMGIYGKSIQCKWCSITKRYWLETGNKAGLSPDRVERILEGIVNQVPTVIDMVYKNLPVGFPPALVDSICKGMEKTAKNLI